MKKKNKTYFYNLRKQFYFDLIALLDRLEEKFIKRLNNFFNRIIKRLLKKIDSLFSIKKELNDIVSKPKELENIFKKYYKQVGTVSVKQLNKEIKKISGKQSKLKFYDNNENLRLKAEKLAIKKLNDVKKIVLAKIKQIDPENKSEIRNAIKKTHNVLKNRHVKVISRNESTYSANQARLEAIKKSTIVKGYVFLAVIDKRTTNICSKRHKQVLPLDSNFLKMYIPPLHHNCRSLLSPLTIFEDLPFSSDTDLKNVPEANFKYKKK
jgi:SPP1 gp7 family putative phage head morphogenesis protein